MIRVILRIFPGQLMDFVGNVLHEASLVGSGTIEGLSAATNDAVHHPLECAGKIVGAAAVGGGLSLLQGRLGMLALAGEIAGGAMSAAFGWDVVRRTSEISTALERSWGNQAEDRASKQIIGRATGSMIVDGLLMSAGGLGGARLARPLSLRLASDALYVPTIHLDEQFRYRARTPFDKDTSEARIYTDLKDSIVRVSGFSQHGGGTYVNHESGFFVDPSGQIMTALHSVKGAHTIEVRTAPGDTFAARLEHFDAANDLALLKITDRSADGSFKSLSLASSASRLTEGSPVFGLGVPAPTIGANTLFLSPGKFLQRESLLQSNEVATNSIARQAAGENLEREVLQGEMHIEGGMSGGPLVDSQGHVLGLITGSRRYKGELPSVAKATPVDALRALYHLAVGTL